MRSSFFLLLTLFIACCNIDNFLIDDLLVDTSTRSLPAEVQLHPGQSVLFPHEGYTIIFEKVTADSRCPIGVQCVWAGDGAAKLKFKDTADAVSEDTLHTTLEPQSVQFQRLDVRMKSLEPYPVYNEPTDPSEYVVTLEISRAGTDSLKTK